MDKGWLQSSKSGASSGSLAASKTLYDTVLNEVRVHGSLYHRHIPLLLAVIDETAAVKADDDSSDEQVMQRLRDGSVSEEDVLGKQCVYLVMELCKGGALMQETGEGGFARGAGAAAAQSTFQPEAAAWYTLHVLRALAYLHARGIAHRDVKPSNILLSPQPFDLALLCDLGSSVDLQGSTSGDRVLRSRSNLPAAPLPSEVTGEESDWLEAAPAWDGGSPLRDTSALTPAFQPPECITPPYEYDAYAADIWALGVTLHCMLTGRTPWEATTEHGMYAEISNSEYDALKQVKQKFAATASAGHTPPPSTSADDMPPAPAGVFGGSSADDMPPAPAGVFGGSSADDMPPAPAGVFGGSSADDMPPAPAGVFGGSTPAAASTAGMLDFLHSCLQRDAGARPSAVQLLRHPWLQAARARYTEAHLETLALIAAGGN